MNNSLKQLKRGDYQNKLKTRNQWYAIYNKNKIKTEK